MTEPLGRRKKRSITETSLFYLNEDKKLNEAERNKRVRKGKCNENVINNYKVFGISYVDFVLK